MWGSLAETNRQYWMRNLAVVLVGVVLSAVVAATGLTTLMGLTVGLIGGSIAGLKMGFGKSVGVWQKHDRYFRVNKEHMKASDAAQRARSEGMTERQRAERDLMSVAPDAGSDDGSDARGKGM